MEDGGGMVGVHVHEAFEKLAFQGGEIGCTECESNQVEPFTFFQCRRAMVV